MLIICCLRSQIILICIFSSNEDSGGNYRNCDSWKDLAGTRGGDHGRGRKHGVDFPEERYRFDRKEDPGERRAGCFAAFPLSLERDYP